MTARLTIAAWTTLKPPSDHLHFSVWPEASEYLPRPTMQVLPQLFDSGSDAAGVGMSLHYGVDAAFYRPPTGSLRDAPGRALAICRTSDTAAALLAASWHLYRAASGHQPISMIDRIAHSYAAVDVICEPPNPIKRGRKLQAGKLRLAAILQDEELLSALRAAGFTKTDVEAFDEAARQVRNDAQHAREGVRAALGFPAESSTGFNTSTGFAEIAYGLGLVLPAHLWHRMLEADFDATAWDSEFAKG